MESVCTVVADYLGASQQPLGKARAGPEETLNLPPSAISPLGWGNLVTLASRLGLDFGPSTSYYHSMRFPPTTSWAIEINEVDPIEDMVLLMQLTFKSPLIQNL